MEDNISAFSSNEQKSIEKKTKSVKESNIALISWEDRFEIKEICSFIETNNHQIIALQFPDYLLTSSSKVLEEIKKRTGKVVFILADTSYGSCCVDEVAASHLNASCIIHFGSACLTLNKQLPVFYVFEKLMIDEDHFVQEIEIKMKEKEVEETKQIFLVVDVEFDYKIKIIAEKLHQKLNSEKFSLFYSEINKIRNVANCETIKNNEENFIGRKIINFSENKVEKLDFKNSKVVFIGDKNSPLLENIFLTFNMNQILVYDSSQFSYDSKNGKIENSSLENWKNSNLTSQQKVNLIKRYYMIEKIRDSESIGILILSISLRDCLPVINHVKELIKNSGKKYYLFVIGKLNVSKLLNFAQMDVFVVISCPFNSVKDSKKYMKPLATPFELQVALDAREWNGEYFTEFESVLKIEESDAKEGETEARVSLISGKIHQIKEKKNSSQQMSSERQIVIANKGDIMKISPASFHLSKKEFKGLDPVVENIPVVKAVQGKMGIAMSYESDVENINLVQEQKKEIKTEIKKEKEEVLNEVKVNEEENDPNYSEKQEGDLEELF